MYKSSNIIEERKDFVESTRDVFLINALYDAVVDGDVMTVGYLLQHKKVDPNCVLEEYDAAPLHTATGIGTEELALQLVQLLLTYGANPNLQTSDGTTPLIITCIFGRTSVASLLFKYGGNPLIEDTEGMNAIKYAYENSFLIMQDVFSNYDWSILESSDGSVIDKNNITKRFISIFNDNISFKPHTSLGNKVEFSDIESDINCAEFGAFNTAFCESGDSSFSSTGTFFSIVNKNGSTNSDLNQYNGNLKISDDSYKLSEFDSSENLTKSFSSQLSYISYRTDRIKYELKRHNINHGPITTSTKQVYYNLIKKVIKGKKKGPFDVGEFSHLPEVLRSTLDSNVKQLVLKWTNLEEQLSKNFSDSNKVWRGGREKQFFTYLLLDPFITNNLASTKNDISDIEVWKTFVLSIFYIGKGKNSRPFSHLYEALKNNIKKTVNKKVCRIQTIWEKSAGVICLHIFHNVICAEAHTREAAMIDSIGLSNLTNIQSGEYYGIVKNWCLKQKQQLGVVLLNKALQIYLAEGERQIFPTDLKSGK